MLPLRLVLPLVFLFTAAARADSTNSLAGTWRIDQARSTDLTPWKSYDLVITVTGDAVTLHRQLAWGRREFSDTVTVDTTGATRVIPVGLWPDNRHLGAYIGGDGTKRVHAEWLDDRRILRLSTDLVLDTQQGPRAINILSDYKVSASGARLTLTELRSTRNRPVVYVFARVTSEPK